MVFVGCACQASDPNIIQIRFKIVLELFLDLVLFLKDAFAIATQPVTEVPNMRGITQGDLSDICGERFCWLVDLFGISWQLDLSH